MTEPTYEPKREPHVGPDFKVGPHPTGPKSPDAALAAIDEILKGNGAAADLVGLVMQLDEAHQAPLRLRLTEVAQICTGDITLEVGDLLKVPHGEILKAAFVAARGQPTSSRLGRVLSALDSADLDQMDASTIDRIATLLEGQPMLVVMPKLGRQVTYLDKHPRLLRWLIKSTPPGVVAELMGTGGSQSLGTVLDELHLWEPWIDHVHVALRSYAFLASGSSDPEVKRRLLAPFGKRAKLSESGDVQIDEPSPDAGAAIEQATLTGAPRSRLLEAIGISGEIAPDTFAEVIAAMRRVHASAEDVLAVTALVALPDVAWLHLLLDSVGVTSSHVMAFLGQNKISVTELTEPVVRALRTRAGKALHLYQLAPDHNQAEHRAIVESELLRQWFLEDATPNELLWLCTSAGDLVSRATRVVVARYPDWRWVRSLTGGEDAVQLRALALACHDAATEKFIREELLHDQKGIASFGHGETSSRAFEGERERLRFAIALGEPENVMARLADLDDHERRAFGRDVAAVADLAGALDALQFARAADLIDLNYTQSLAHCPRGPAILVHLEGRPQAEQAAALADVPVVARAAKDVLPDLLTVFPSLASRAVLAKALASNAGLLRLLLLGSDPNRVMELIGVEPAATPALELLAEDDALVRLLPARSHMSKAASGFVDRLAHEPDLDAETTDTVERVRSDEDLDDRIAGASADERAAVVRAGAIHDLAAAGSLSEALDQLIAGDLRRDPAALLAVLASHKADVPALLGDPSQWPRVAQLARRLDLPPALACPFISTELLLQMPNALRWYFELEDKTALLRMVGRPGVASLIGQHLGADVPGARAWLAALPHGAALTDDERQLIDQLERATTSRELLRTLFEIRFGVPPPAAYNASELESLYRIVNRLPHAHLDQERIKRISVESIQMPNVDGLWNGEARVVTIGESKREGTSGMSEFHSHTLDASPEQDWLTAAEVHHAFGYDDAAIAAQVKAKNLMSKDVDGLTLYKTKPVEIDTFTQIVLHEIGHSIDDILGDHTAPVFQFAGWREFNDDQFDVWAGEMGGWDRVSAPDKAQIKQAWIDAARAGHGVHDLVSADHPAMAERYDEVGIVRAGREHRTFSAWKRDILNGRMFVAGSYPGRWYSLAAAVVPSAPSDYSLYAPQEYFAESYVEYYRGVDGSPASQKNKGGGLAAPVKKYFDERVDALRYDPRRFEAKDDTSA